MKFCKQMNNNTIYNQWQATKEKYIDENTMNHFLVDKRECSGCTLYILIHTHIHTYMSSLSKKMFRDQVG